MWGAHDLVPTLPPVFVKRLYYLVRGVLDSRLARPALCFGVGGSEIQIRSSESVSLDIPGDPGWQLNTTPDAPAMGSRVNNGEAWDCNRYRRRNHGSSAVSSQDAGLVGCFDFVAN